MEQKSQSCIDGSRNAFLIRVEEKQTGTDAGPRQVPC
jgi:hypothetical protein